MNDESSQNEIKTKQPGINIPGILLRLFLAGLAGLIIGAVIYYTAAGWIPYLDQRVIQPIDENQENLLVVKETQQAQELYFKDMQNQLEQSLATIAVLETILMEDADQQSSLQLTITTNSNNLNIQTQAVGTLEANLMVINQELSVLATNQVQSDWVMSNLSLLKVVDMLTLANQYLNQSNYGLAENELVLANDELTTLIEGSPAQYQNYLISIKELVDGGIQDLPEEYSLAFEKIQLARQIAFQGLPQSDSVTTPTPYLTPTFTPTPGS